MADDLNTEFTQIDYSNEKILLSKSRLEMVLSYIRYWSQLGIICYLRQLLENKQKNEFKNLHSITYWPKFIRLHWSPVESDSIALLLISR